MEYRLYVVSDWVSSNSRHRVQSDRKAHIVLVCVNVLHRLCAPHRLQQLRNTSVCVRPTRGWVPASPSGPNPKPWRPDPKLWGTNPKLWRTDLKLWGSNLKLWGPNPKPSKPAQRCCTRVRPKVLAVSHNVVSALFMDSFRHQLETFPRFQTAILLLLFLQWNRVYLGHH